MQTPFNIKEIDMGDFNMGMNTTHEMHTFPSNHALPTQQTRQNPSPIPYTNQYESSPVTLEETFQTEEEDGPQPIDESHVFHPGFADEMLYDASDKTTGSKAKSFFKRYWWVLLLVVILGIGGLAWWYYNNRKEHSSGVPSLLGDNLSRTSPLRNGALVSDESLPSPHKMEQILTSL